MTGSQSAVVRKPLPVDDPRRRRPDITRASKLLGWTPRTTLDAGLRATISWFAAEVERRSAQPVRRRPALTGALQV
jgi:UDP-glucuronate decarboxylase